MKQKAIFLDRDGILNQVVIKKGKPYPPASMAELVIPHDVQMALDRLKSAGFLLIGATNQPDVARGITPLALVEEINAKLMAMLPLNEIRVCYHDDIDQCNCRKPAPGLLIQAAHDHHIDLTMSVMIGDRWKDIEAGQRAGCKTIWIDQSYQEKKPVKPDYITTSLSDATEWIMSSHSR